MVALVDLMALALSAKGGKPDRLELARLAVEGAYAEAAVPGEDAFEAWLIEKWLLQIRSPAFRASVQGQQLIAEWERGG